MLCLKSWGAQMVWLQRKFQVKIFWNLERDNYESPLGELLLFWQWDGLPHYTFKFGDYILPVIYFESLSPSGTHNSLTPTLIVFFDGEMPAKKAHHFILFHSPSCRTHHQSSTSSHTCHSMWKHSSSAIQTALENFKQVIHMEALHSIDRKKIDIPLFRLLRIANKGGLGNCRQRRTNKQWTTLLDISPHNNRIAKASMVHG